MIWSPGITDDITRLQYFAMTTIWVDLLLGMSGRSAIRKADHERSDAMVQTLSFGMPLGYFGTAKKLHILMLITPETTALMGFVMAFIEIGLRIAVKPRDKLMAIWAR